MARTTTPSADLKLAVRRSRTGLGLFAVDAIAEDTCIIEYTGRILTDAEYEASRSRYLFDLGKGKVLDGTPRMNRARYINHSCVPNCEPQIKSGRILIYALRDIAPGEELTYDYGTEYFDAYLKGKCRCPKCMPEVATPANTTRKCRSRPVETAAPVEAPSAAA